MNISLDRMLGIAGSCGKAWDVDAMSDKGQLYLHVSLSAHSQSRPEYIVLGECAASVRDWELIIILYF